jgi:hypothetical protein
MTLPNELMSKEGIVNRDEHGLVLEEKQTELNQTIFRIYNN